jgi:hypothetical protein
MIMQMAISKVMDIKHIDIRCNITTVGEITTVSRASSNFASLRTVIPMSIIKQWKLKEGDRIDWEWEVLKGEMVLVVKKLKK